MTYPRLLAATATALLTLACSPSSSVTAPTPAGPTTPAATFRVTSSAGSDGGSLPMEFTCDGAGVSPPLQLEGAPSSTREFAVLMTTLPGDGTTKWNWVLYGIPSTVSSLARGAVGVGTQGYGSDGPSPGYQPPCSQGPGAKAYTFTVVALSAPPALPAGRITGAVLTTAIAPVTAASSAMTMSYTRPLSSLQEMP